MKDQVDFAKEVLVAFGSTFGLKVENMIGKGDPRPQSIAILQQPRSGSIYLFPLYGETPGHVRQMNPELEELIRAGVALNTLASAR